MKFLVDRCAGHLLAEWLREQGQDVVEAKDLGPDPGDRTLLQWAASDGCVLVTIDKDFGELVFLHGLQHTGLVRLPDVPVNPRIRLMQALLAGYSSELAEGAVITVRGGRIRITRSQS